MSIKKIKKLFVVMITLGASIFTLSSARIVAEEDNYDDWEFRCIQGEINIGRCYGSPGSEYCASSINPWKTCAGSMGLPPLD